MPIQILSPEVANQIAAGEVVERPASAVKELIENSLDAGATDIRVEIREGGQRLIRVHDNGYGIPAAEAALAFQRHATSKIRTADDLGHITTLGFRGEALASIAAVSRVTLQTRARDEELGVMLRLAEGREVAREPSGGQVGTVVTVEHLFANVPARLKFLKQPATEAGHVQQIVTRHALAYPERRLSLISDGRLVFQSTGSGKLHDVLVRVYGLEIAQQMLPLPEVTASVDDAPRRPSAPSVTGFVGVPGLHRSHRGYLTLFVNRRWFQDASVAYGVIQAYHTLLPTGRYPVAILLLQVDPADVDVNVHPTKAEVRFRDSHAVFSAVQRAVRRVLTEHAPVAKAELGRATAEESSPHQMAWGELGDWSERREALLGAGRRPEGAGISAGTSAASPGLQPAQFSGDPSAGPRDALVTPALPQEADGIRPAATAGPPLLPLLRVVGQLAAAYIVAEGPDGMYLIDQHAAHERVLYEQMLAERSAQTLAVQPLLEPVVADFSPEQAVIVAEELDRLNELGIAIEPFGSSSYLVRSLPVVLARDNPQSALTEIVDGLAGLSDLVADAHEAALVTLICKRAAVKGGHVLGLPEMQELVRRLEGCRSPRTCPHGRPTMIYVSATELARHFGRK